MIVIMGASGQVGGAALNELANSGQSIRALSRTERTDDRANVEWAAVDARDAGQLAAAMRGAKAAFVLNPVDARAEDVHADADAMSEAVATAIEAAHVPFAVVLSSQGAHLPAGTGMVAALHRFEERLDETGIPLAVLRPAYFMESWLPFAGIAMASGEQPALISPTDRAIDCISATDVGRTVACCLSSPQPGIVNLVGPERYSEEDAARIVADIAGRPVAVVPVPASRVAAVHEEAGMSPSFAAEVAGLYAAINADAIPFDDQGMMMPWTTTLEEVLRASLGNGGNGR